MNIHDYQYNFLLNYTPQLFYYPYYTEEDKRKVLRVQPEQIASCVLFKTETSFFLITAKHTFNNIQISDVIIFLNGNSLMRLPNDAGFIISKEEHDNKDIIILRLPDKTACNIISKYLFLDYRFIDFRHEFVPTEKYLFLGFINGQTKLERKTFLSNPFGFITKIKKIKKIDKLGFNYSDNIILSYNRRKQGFLLGNSPDFGPKDLSGLSGGGIWNLKKVDYLKGEYYFLVGIMIEERTNRGIIIGTQIRLALNILWHRFSTFLMV
jgi:hypothetical protein